MKIQTKIILVILLIILVTTTIVLAQPEQLYNNHPIYVVKLKVILANL